MFIGMLAAVSIDYNLFSQSLSECLCSESIYHEYHEHVKSMDMDEIIFVINYNITLK
jgi:hypothetical protein